MEPRTLTDTPPARETGADFAPESRKKRKQGLGVFECYLSIWVALCIVAGVAIGQVIPAIPNVLGQMNVAQVNLPVAVLIWAMIFPMMM